MHRPSSLPSPPHFDIEVIRDRRPDEPAFLKTTSRVMRTAQAEGTKSEEFIYDEVDRKAIDAVVIVAFFMASHEGASVPHVVLRSAVRPPVVLRDDARTSRPEPENRALWELPAGLVEPEEQGSAGLRRAACRELLEETGFAVEPEALVELGPSVFPAPGLIAERQYFFRVEVEPSLRGEPTLDGSPLEAAGAVVAVPLSVALTAARAGDLADSKTELALRRLAEVVP